MNAADNVDLTALSGIRNLTELRLNHASIVSDLSSLASHTSLRTLELGETGLQSLDVIPPSIFASLQDIHLHLNLITDVGPLLSYGRELRRVDLRDNPWLSRSAVETDIPALIARGVEVTYDLPTGELPDYEVVADAALRRALVRQLVNETLYYGGIVGGSRTYFYEEPVPVGKLANAPNLKLSNQGIVSLEGMEQAVSLNFLWLSGNEISDISPLMDLPLRVLTLDGNPIDVQSLAGISTAYLALDNTGLRELPPLRAWYLFLTDNSITDLSPLSPRDHLELWLGGNSISSLAPLRSQVNFLHLNGNEVGDLAGVDLTVLEELHIGNNALRDISPLLDAPLLSVLDVGRNPWERMRWRSPRPCVSGVRPYSWATRCRSCPRPASGGRASCAWLIGAPRAATCSSRRGTMAAFAPGRWVCR